MFLLYLKPFEGDNIKGIDIPSLEFVNDIINRDLQVMNDLTHENILDPKVTRASLYLVLHIRSSFSILRILEGKFSSSYSATPLHIW